MKERWIEVGDELGLSKWKGDEERRGIGQEEGREWPWGEKGEECGGGGMSWGGVSFALRGKARLQSETRSIGADEGSRGSTILSHR